MPRKILFIAFCVLSSIFAVAQFGNKAASAEGTPFQFEWKQPTVEKHTTIWGRVFDTLGKPVRNAHVFLWWPDPLCGNLADAETDADGHYELLCNPDGPTRASFGAFMQNAACPNAKYTHLAPETQPKAEVLLIPGSRVKLDFHLGHQSGCLEGIVIDSTTKAVVPNARITMHRSQTQLQYSTEISQDGNFVFALPTVPIEISITAPGYQPWKFKDPQTSASTLNLTNADHRVITIEMLPAQ